jgi:hypothetical protein
VFLSGGGAITPVGIDDRVSVVRCSPKRLSMTPVVCAPDGTPSGYLEKTEFKINLNLLFQYAQSL